MGSMYPVRHIFAYGILSTFLIFVLFYGFADSLLKMDTMGGSRKSWGMFDSLKHQNDVKQSFPDLSQYKPLRTLSPKEFPIDDPTKRVLIVGDIHGMINSLEKLLKRVKYSPSQDVVFHVGDIISKGSLQGSLAVLQFMASNNVTGVRGNHDQLVIEWRTWIQWVSSRSDGKDWLDHLQAKWDKTQAEDPDTDLEKWLRRQRKASSRKDKELWKLIPTSWVILDDHYKIAKDMSDLHFQYLLHLPLRLYIPSAHTFIVHAGILPSDPRYPVDDKARQPLARMPTLARQSAGNQSSVNETLLEDGGVNSTSNTSKKTIDALRNLQEIGILTQIPQNSDPWVVLNMRSVLANGKISKRSNEGLSWSKIWKQHMENCVGYTSSKRLHSVRQDTDDIDDVADSPTSDDTDAEGMKKYNLKCYPSTTIFGHAAGRGLDTKRWSFGLDTGCVYNKKLSALVIKGQSKNLRNSSSADNYRPNGNSTEPDESDGDEEYEDDDEEDQSDDVSTSKNKDKNKKKRPWLPFGDNNRAKVIAVKCQA